MYISFETKYDLKTMAAMARALRKTVRRKRSLRVRTAGWIVAAIALFSSIPTTGGGPDIRSAITVAAAVVLIVFLVSQDRINAYFAGRRLLPGTEKADAVFYDDEFVSCTAVGKSSFYYDRIKQIAESDDYFIFIFSGSHAQAYDKKKISGKTPEEFRDFIEKKTGLKVLKI